MASRYSLTVQINPNFPGHAAVVVNEPSKQTYAGFGPQRHYSPWSYGKFDIHSLSPGEIPPPDFSSVIGQGQYKTFTVPITEQQATRALHEIERIHNANGNYNFFDSNICTTIVNRIAEAAGLGRDVLPRVLPSYNGEYLSNIEQTLAANPKAKVAFDGAGMPAAIPESLRGVQQDYAFVGAGYDTPSERNGHLPSGPISDQEASPTFEDRFGKWSNSPETSESSSLPQSAGSGERRPPERYLRSRQVSPSGASVFDRGSTPVPFVPNSALSQPTSPAFDQRFGTWAPPARGAMPTAPSQAQSEFNSWSGPDGASSRQPLPLYPAPPIFGGNDPSASSGDDMSDWFARWIKPLMQR
ncbi:hypothetical protein ACQR1W_38125 [Bradyrhizobium sp. HKCCYLS1011]|uniref:hypothetical protein n=1 Tax=Bradyrhizobium sp. HKCCYLS1011 TaxID=3420733 RepID=UPI003EBA79DC